MGVGLFGRSYLSQSGEQLPENVNGPLVAIRDLSILICQRKDIQFLKELQT